MKKIIILALAGVLIASVVPVQASLNGTWAGEGAGICYPPFPTIAPHPIHAWQQWTGEVEKMEVFYGKWEDEYGNYGRFKGDVTILNRTWADAKGKWTWFNIFVDPPQEISMGEFKMKFNMVYEYCEDEWYCETSPSIPGRMKGKRIGD